MELSASAKVGMLTVVALILLGLVFVHVGHMGPAEGVQYNVLFKQVDGLQVRANVQLSGVRIGYVTGLTLTPQNNVNVGITVTREDAKLFSSDYFTYTIIGNLLGDKWVEIIPGPVPEGVKPLAAGETVSGTTPVSFSQLAEEGSEVMKQLQVSIQALNDIVGDAGFQSDLKATMTNFRDVSGNLKGASEDARLLVRNLSSRVDILADSLQRVVNNVDNTVTVFGRDAQAIGGNLREATDGVRHIVSANTKNVDEIVANLRDLSLSLKNTATAVEALATDPTISEDVKTIAANIRKTSEEVAGIASDVRSVTSDPQVQEDLKETLHNVREASESGKRVVNKVEGTVDKINGKLDGKDGLLGGRIFQADISHEWNTRTGAPSANINGTLFPDGRFNLMLGVDSIGQKNLVNLQAGHKWENFRVRGGVIRSQFGIGCDAWMFDKRFETSLDVYDTRDVKVDILGRVILPADFYVYGGVRDTFDKDNRNAVVGVGKRF